MVKLKRILTESNEDNEQPKSTQDYLMLLLNMLFKSRKVNPKGNSLEGNYRFIRPDVVEVLNRSIGDWKLDLVTDNGYNIITDDSIAPEDYKGKDVAPVPGKQGEYFHPNTPGNSAYYVHDTYNLNNENEIKKIIGAFCKINKCLVDYNLWSVGTGPESVRIQLTLKRSPTYQPKKYRPQWGDSDSDWETLDDQERRHNSLYHGWR